MAQVLDFLIGLVMDQSLAIDSESLRAPRPASHSARLAIRSVQRRALGR